MPFGKMDGSPFPVGAAAVSNIILMRHKKYHINDPHRTHTHSTSKDTDLHDEGRDPDRASIWNVII
jgi:hypothetical protein